MDFKKIILIVSGLCLIGVALYGLSYNAHRSHVVSFPGINSLAILSDAESRSITPENPTGEKGKGAMAVPGSNIPSSFPARDLGQGWKVRPYINLEPGETVVLADMKGPGQIDHIWLTVTEKVYRQAILRIYWDGEKTPSVESPVGDFFCNGHGLRYKVNSLMVCVNPSGGFNCYWPMPFRKSCKITLENRYPGKVVGLFYQISYSLGQIPKNSGYFHAQFRKGLTTQKYPEHIILEGVKGRGQYVGTFLSWSQRTSGWWGEGEVKFYFDGDNRFPTICGTGMEDYFGGAWCFGEEYSSPYSGYPLFDKKTGKLPRHAMYRWHITDPVRFKQDLKVTVQALGWDSTQSKYQPLEDDVASVAYWYQTEPHTPFPSFPSNLE